ncbi:MAG: hypothetical protein PHG67_06435 [Bacteroidales bacterium]|nr:hypothetical protein [Bacteroidales bacterium]HOI32272.1 hypothetical protein [Bacteroidales bacterium]
MKAIVPLLFLLFFSIATKAQVQFEDPVNLSDEYGPSRDHAMTNINEKYYLVWDQWGDLMFRKSQDAGLSWGGKITLYTSLDYGASYPVIAASNGNVFVFYYRNTTGKSQIFMIKSTDDGQSFGNEIQLSNAINGAQVPQIAIAGDTLVLAFEDRDSDYDYQIFVMTSIDAGENWSAPVNVSNTTSGARWCNVALHNDNIFTFWNDQTGPDYDDLDVFFSKSTDFGQNWSSPQNISNNQAYNARLQTKVINNSIYTLSSSKIDGLQTDIILFRSDDLGDTWQTPFNLSDNSGPSERPFLWVTDENPAQHRIYAVWSDGSYSGNDKAYLKYSIDNGQNWSDILPFSQNTEDASWPQIMGFHDLGTDRLFMSYFRPLDGTFDYEIYGVRALNLLEENIQLSGQITDLQENGLSNAMIVLNGINYSTNESGYFSLELIPGTYNLQAHAPDFLSYYENGLELTSDTEITIPLEAMLFPPLNLSGQESGSVVELNWDAPASQGEWLHWDDGSNSDAVGGENISMFDAAIRFTPADLQAYDGQFVSRVAAFFTAVDAEFSIRVWQGGSQTYAGNLLIDQPIPNPLAGEWNEIELDNPVQIDADQELWIGYRVNNTGGGYPAGTDNGPAIPFKGDMLLYGPDWVSMSDNFGWNINWNIQALVVSDGGEGQTLQKLTDKLPTNAGDPQKIKTNTTAKSFRFTFDGFKIYRNESLIGETNSDEMSFTDENPELINTYYATAFRDSYESVASNEVDIVITSLEEQTVQSLLMISPNPANNNFSVQFKLNRPDIIELQIFDQNGKLLSRKSHSLQAGNHTIRLNRNQLNLTEKSSLLMIRLDGVHHQFSNKLLLN